MVVPETLELLGPWPLATLMIQLAGSSGVGTDMVLSILVKVGAVRVPFA